MWTTLESQSFQWTSMSIKTCLALTLPLVLSQTVAFDSLNVRNKKNVPEMSDHVEIQETYKAH